MANYEITFLTGNEIASVVLRATGQQAASEAFASAHKDVSGTDIISVENLETRYHKYRAATFVARLISFGGWIVLALGVMGLIGSFGAAHNVASQRGLNGLDQTLEMAMAYMLRIFSALCVAMGLSMAAMGQHLLATTDAARHLGKILTRTRTGIRSSRPESTPSDMHKASTAHFCSSCGAATVEGSSAFCSQCGAKL